MKRREYYEKTALILILAVVLLLSACSNKQNQPANMVDGVNPFKGFETYIGAKRSLFPEQGEIAVAEKEQQEILNAAQDIGEAVVFTSCFFEGQPDLFTQNIDNKNERGYPLVNITPPDSSFAVTFEQFGNLKVNYFEVASYNSLDELENAILNYFSQAIYEKLFQAHIGINLPQDNQNQAFGYIQVDEKVYSTPIGTIGGAVGYQPSTAKIVSASEDKAIVEMLGSSNFMTDYPCWIYLVKENGKWVFDQAVNG